MAPTTLLTLLPELLHHLTTHLTYTSHLALSLTCKTLLARLDDPNQRPLIPRAAPSGGNTTALPAKPYTMADLLDIERWPVYRINYGFMRECQPEDYFACNRCLHLRSALHFAKKMTTGEPRKDRGCRVEQEKRFCIRCGIAGGMYERGSVIEFACVTGKTGTVCIGCGKMVRDMERQPREDVSRLFCEPCWGRGRWIDGLNPRDLTLRRTHCHYFANRDF